MSGVDQAGDLEGAPFRAVRFFSSDVEFYDGPGDSHLMRSKEALKPYAARVGEWLERWVKEAPERVFLVEQTPAGERQISYGETHQRVMQLAEGLLAFGLSAERPLAVIAPAGIEHGLIMIAAYHVGIPIAPVAPAYALLGTDFNKLRNVFSTLTPGLVVVADGVAYGKALRATLDADVPVVALAHAAAPGQRDFSTLEGDGSRRIEVELAAARVTHDTIAKFMFTSGSTGSPKAVINTHRMMCASAQQQRQVTAFLDEQPPVMVDWLPWNHTAGGNSIFNITLYNGGTLYIDPGKPTREHIGATIKLLKRVSPTLYFNVPLGFESLLPYLQEDAALRRTFFAKLQFIWYSAATMQPATWNALERLALQTVGERVLILTGLGMTETSPAALFGNLRANGPGIVGVPIPGVDLKLRGRDDQYDVLYRGPNVTPGYWRDPSATQAAFDEDGFLISGDIVSFVQPGDPGAGLRFEGRAGEDFKLSSGTRVSAASLRLKALEALAPWITDVVVAGAGRDDVRILMFPDWARCGRDFQPDQPLAPADLINVQALRNTLQERLQSLHQSATGSSNRVVAGIVVLTPPSPSNGELTEKGTINGRLLLRNRPQLLDLVFGRERSSFVLIAEDGKKPS